MAKGNIPFTVKETAGVTRVSEVLHWPVAIPLRHDEPIDATKFSVTLASGGTLDANGVFQPGTDTGTAVPTQFSVGPYNGAVPPATAGFTAAPRWGNFDDTTKPFRVVWTYPQLSMPSATSVTIAGIVYQGLWFHTSGGTGSAAGSITVNTQPTYYEVNTGLNGILIRIPRSGAGFLWNRLESLNSLGAATGQLHGTATLWAHGIATSADIFTTVDNQNQDYFSSNDVSGTTTDPGGSATETVLPARYFTSLWDTGGLRTVVLQRTLRLLSSGGTHFQGQNSETSGVSNPLPVARDVHVDVEYHFFANRAGFRVRVINKGTRGTWFGFNLGKCSDIAYQGFGVEFDTGYGVNASCSTRDESATTEPKSVTWTPSAVATIRTLHTIDTTPKYNWTLHTVNGPTYAGVPTQQCNAFFDATASDNSRGITVIPWNWRNRFPMGWQYTPATAALRWEILNMEDVDVDAQRTYHVQRGYQFLYAECWVEPHVGAYGAGTTLNAINTDTGIFEQSVNNVYVVGTQTSQGNQQPSLLGSCDSEHWNDTQAWWAALAPASVALPAFVDTSAGKPAQLLGLPSQLGLANAFADAVFRWKKWFYTKIDGQFSGAGTPSNGWTTLSVRDNQLYSMYGGWRNEGCISSIISSASGAGDYEYGSTAWKGFIHWQDRGFYSFAWEQALHQTTIDVNHQFRGIFGEYSGMQIDIASFLGSFHTGTAAAAGQEYQQQCEAVMLCWFMTGDRLFREAVDFYADFHEDYWFAGNGVGAFFTNARGWGFATGTLTSGSNVMTNVVGDMAGFPVSLPNNVYWVDRFYTFLRAGTTLASSGRTVTFSANPGFWANPPTDPGLWVGSILRTAQGDFTIAAIGPDNVTCTVDPVPSPALSGMAFTAILGSFIGGPLFIAGADPVNRTLTFSSPNFGNETASNSESNVRVVGNVLPGLTRMFAWPLVAQIAIAKCVGKNLPTANYASRNLIKNIVDFSHVLLNGEQRISHPNMLTAHGGVGVWSGLWGTGLGGTNGPPFGELMGTDVPFGWGSHTYFDYAQFAVREAQDFLDLWGTLISLADAPSALTAAMLALEARIVGWDLTGPGGLDWIPNGDPNVRKAPWTRGGQVNSNTQIIPLSENYYFALTDIGGGIAGTVSWPDLTNIPSRGLPIQHPSNWNITGGIIGNNTQDVYVVITSELAAHVAKKLYNISGDTARRDWFLQMGVLAWTTGLLLGGTQNPAPQGGTADPRNYGQISAGLATNAISLNGGTSRAHEITRASDHLLRLLQTGFNFSSFTWLQTQGTLTVVFTDTSPGATAWAWTFGDGGTSSLQNPSHTYTAAGTYTVQETVTLPSGPSTTSQSVVVALGIPLTAVALTWTGQALTITSGGGGGGTVAFDAVSTGTGAVSYSFTHTPVGTPTAVIVAMTGESNNSRNYAVTYGGTALSLLGTANSPDASTRQMLFGLVNPAVGAQTVAVSFVGNTQTDVACITFTGTNLGVPFGAPVVASANSGNPSVALTGVAASSLMVAAVGNSQPTSPVAKAFTVAAPGTARWNFVDAGPWEALAGQTLAAAGSTTFTWTNNSTGGTAWSAVAVEVVIPHVTTLPLDPAALSLAGGVLAINDVTQIATVQSTLTWTGQAVSIATLQLMPAVLTWTGQALTQPGQFFILPRIGRGSLRGF